MKNTMIKSTFREIKGSFGRWFAILAIVALGVGFFSGLKVCKAAFLETGNTYLAEHNLFDFQLMSTLGLESEDVSEIQKLNNVKTAEGSYSADLLVSIDEENSGEIVSKFHTISKNINTPSLKSGKMPVSADECLADAQYFTKEDIGKKIKISSSNKKEASDMLVYDTYTITGIADSPLYMNFERGSSSIGNGKIDCFLLIPENGWDSEIYTEIYVKLNTSAFIFSDEYKESCEDSKLPLEEALAKCSERRYNKIIDEAQSEVDEAALKLKNSESDLAKAEKNLIDSKTKLENTRKELSDAQAKIDQGFKDYEIGVSQYESKKAEVYSQLETAYQLQLITPEEYEYQKRQADAEFETAWQELERSKIQLTTSQADINSGLKQVEDGEVKLQNGYIEVEKGRTEIEKAKTKLNDAQIEIDKIEHPDDYVLDRNTNIGYVCFENDTSIVEGIAKVFPVFFFLVAALVCMTTMSRMIDEQRTQIGVLKALGYSRSQILSKYIFYSSSSAIIGGIGGFFGGTYLFTYVIWEAYGMLYGFSDVIFVFDWLTGGLALLAAILCAVGTTIYSCYHELSQVPAELIRPKAPAAGKRIFLERLPFIWDKLKFLHKVSARNIFRYKKRFFMMVIGICGCTALLVTGLGVKDSIENVVSIQYDEIYHVDYSVTFNKSMSSQDIKEFEEENKDIIDSALFLYTGTVDARSNGTIKSVNLVVCDKDNDISDFIDFHNDEGKLEYPKKGEGIINTNLAETLNIKPGDSLSVYDSNQKEITVKITGLCDNYVYNYLYINDETYNDIYGYTEINSAYVLADYGKSEQPGTAHEIGSKLMDAKHVSSVSVTQDFKDRIDNMMTSLDYIVALIVLCAGALAFIVLYNLTNINITERIREIATIKVLGFYPSETSSYVFRENIVLTAISALVGLPLGTALHAFVMSRVKIDLLSFDVHIEPSSYIIGVLGTFAFAAIVNFVMYYKINKISMTESLKSIE